MIYTFSSKEEFDKLNDLVDWQKDGSIVVITGEGFGNVIKSLSNLDRNNNITNVGYCGSNNLPIGTKVRVKNSCAFHPYRDEFAKDAPIQLDRYGDCDCYTSNDFVVETSIKKPAVFDMELYAIANMGFRSVQAIKVVCNTLDVDQYENSLK